MNLFRHVIYSCPVCESNEATKMKCVTKRNGEGEKNQLFIYCGGWKLNHLNSITGLIN